MAGCPITCAVDIMDADENSLYFLTAKGKLYDRLRKGIYCADGNEGQEHHVLRGNIAAGKGKELGNTLLPRLFEKNPYMWKIYPNTGIPKCADSVPNL